MKERPILFSGPMVRAILDGTKTQTRRVVKPQPSGDVSHFRAISIVTASGAWEFQACAPNNGPVCVFPDGRDSIKAETICPYGAPSDRLWVRETFQICSNYHADCRDTTPPFEDGRPILRHEDPLYPYWEQCYYCASDPCPELLDVDTDTVRCSWRPSIHMPRWASRITLEVTNVRVERLQDISEADARAEGAELLSEDGMSGWGHTDETCPASYTRRNGFRHLWDSINAKRAPWDSNPWVWVVSFTAAPRREEE